MSDNNKTKPTYVLGTGLSHDGSACLLKDGKICVAIEKERITRIKHDGNIDNEAIQYCLSAEGITFDDISLVVQNANFHNFDSGSQAYHGVRRIIPEQTAIVTISHHLAHAYSIVGTSPFDEMAVMVVDGCGSSMDDCTDMDGVQLFEEPLEESKHLYFEKDSFYVYKNNELIPLCKDFSPFGLAFKEYQSNIRPRISKHSIGGLYASISQYIFQGMEDPGKLMGLAPYGQAGVFDDEAFELRDGRVFVNYDWMHKFDRPRLNDVDLENNFQYYADVACWIQREIEKALIYLFNCRAELVDCKNIGYAGGVALNAVANAKLLKSTQFENYYFQPAAADNGLAIGCAYYGWLAILKQERVKHDGSPYFGQSYPESETQIALQSYHSRVRFEKPDNLITQVANLIAEGKVVAWFESGSEFGPRSLGHRSILADPRNAEMQNKINRDIKFREDFRPFAPSVPLEKASIYFDMECPSPYMILVANTKEAWRKKIPAVVHVDGSARVQTVEEQTSPNYLNLLNTFGEMTGVYVLLNTSFNKKGMPIVETPSQAIDYFLECGLDRLVIDGFLIEKATVKPLQKNEDSWNMNMTYKFS